MKKFVVGIIAIALMGCASEYEEPTQTNYDRKDNDIWVVEVSHRGTDLDCVVYNDSNGEGGLSCNWEAYNHLRNP